MTKRAPPRTARLVKRAVDALRPEAARYTVWDAGEDALRGFGVRVETTGRKTFVARYRVREGKDTGTLRQETIGQYGKLTAEEARTLAKRAMGKAAGGADPVGERTAARQKGKTVADVVDWYLKAAEAGRILGRRGRPIKASTLAMDKSRIESHVRPLLGSKPVSTLTLASLEDFQAEVAVRRKVDRKAKKTGKPKRGGLPTGGSGVAARTLGMLGAIFEHARRAGLIKTNPAVGARKMAGSRKLRRLSIDEVRALGAAIRAAEDEDPNALAAIRFTLLSGFRRGETLSIKRDDVVPEGGVELPDSKSGPQRRVIGSAALNVLKAQARKAKDDYLFPSAVIEDGHFVGLPRVLARLCKTAKLTDVSLHTLRHTFASLAAEIGYSELVIRGLLGHSAGNVTQSYVHLDSALVAAADRISVAIAKALDGETTGTVIQLAERK